MIEIDPLIGLRMINDGSLSLISTRREERNNVATLSWQAPLSQEPPMLGISLTPSSCSNHYLQETGEFVLSIPDASLIAEVHYCGTHSGKDVDKVRFMELRTLRSQKVIPLLISNCIGHLECVVHDRQNIGDHIFYSAEVITALVETDYFDKGWNENAQTLYHLGGSLYRTAGHIADALEFPLPDSRISKPSENIFGRGREDVFIEIGPSPDSTP